MNFNELTLRHYRRNRHTIKPRSVKQYPHNRYRFKPRGLWVSVEDFGNGWKEWCEGEGYGLENLKGVFSVTLKDDTNLLLLQSSEDISNFNKKYNFYTELEFFKMPDWGKVAQDYDGMFIAPYKNRLLSFDFDMLWYHTWDCSSGCIWNADIIKTFEVDN